MVMESRIPRTANMSTSQRPVWRRWLYNHQSQGHRYPVSVLCSHHVLYRWRHGHGDPGRTVPARTATGGTLFFNQMTTVHFGLIMVFGAVMPAFTGLANWLIPIMIGALTWRCPHEQLELLDPAVCFPHPPVEPVYGGAAPVLAGPSMPPVHPVQRQQHGPVRLCHFTSWGSPPSWGHQRHRDHLQPAGAGHGLDADAAVCLDLAHHGVSAHRCHAGAGGCGDHGADGQVFPGPVSSMRPVGDPVLFQHIFWFFGRGSLHHDIAGFRHRLPASFDLLPQRSCSVIAPWFIPTSSIALLSFMVWAHHMFTTGCPWWRSCSSCTPPC